MDYKARFYDPLLGKFIQPDTLVPQTGNPQTWNGYSYVFNNPINRTDSSGHDSGPNPYSVDPAALVEAACNWMIANGWEAVGNPTGKNLRTNGPDAVFVRVGDSTSVAVVEVKATSRSSLNMGSFGKLQDGIRQMSRDWIERVAEKFADSSVEALRLESQAISEAETVTTVVFTNVSKVTKKVQEHVDTVVVDGLSENPEIISGAEHFGGGISPRMRDMWR